LVSSLSLASSTAMCGVRLDALLVLAVAELHQ